jgi:hypothetical protein
LLDQDHFERFRAGARGLHVGRVQRADLLAGVDKRGARNVGRDGAQELKTFADQVLAAADEAGHIAARSGETRSEANLYCTRSARDDDRHGSRLPVCGGRGIDGPGEDHIGSRPDQFRRPAIQRLQPAVVPAHVENHFAAFGVSQPFEGLAKYLEPWPLRCFRAVHQHADAPHFRRLRERGWCSQRRDRR